jgi:hypothetical protein
MCAASSIEEWAALERPERLPVFAFLYHPGAAVVDLASGRGQRARNDGIEHRLPALHVARRRVGAKSARSAHQKRAENASTDSAKHRSPA